MLFGDTIQGEYTELVENSKIDMKWKFKEWENFGKCTITFTDAGGAVTDIVVNITDIPDYDKFGSVVHPQAI